MQENHIYLCNSKEVIEAKVFRLSLEETVLARSTWNNISYVEAIRHFGSANDSYAEQGEKCKDNHHLQMNYEEETKPKGNKVIKDKRKDPLITPLNWIRSH